MLFIVAYYLTVVMHEGMHMMAACAVGLHRSALTLNKDSDRHDPAYPSGPHKNLLQVAIKTHSVHAQRAPEQACAGRRHFGLAC